MGLYPAPTDYRVLYNRDGCDGFLIDGSNVVTQMTGPQLTTLNDESDSAVNINSYWAVGIVFPFLVDLSRYFVAYQGGITPGILETSPDTTNLLDGTWTTRANPWVGSPNVKPHYRSATQAVAGGTGINGVRIRKNLYGSGQTAHSLLGLHLYAAAATLTDLQLWHPTLDQRLAPDAFYQGNNQGDAAQGGSYDSTFRVKNLHGTQTANSIVVQTEARAGSTAKGTYLTYSQGGAFAGSQNIGNLAPGAISTVLTLRVTPPTDAEVSLGSPSVLAIPNSWT